MIFFSQNIQKYKEIEGPEFNNQQNNKEHTSIVLENSIFIEIRDKTRIFLSFHP